MELNFGDGALRVGVWGDVEAGEGLATSGDELGIPGGLTLTRDLGHDALHDRR